jgi:hypothetical protein
VITPDARNGVIHQAQQDRMVRDTLILQKVNGAHRAAFKHKFPGQCEHIMRLVAERLQAMVTKKPSDLGDPDTWVASAAEIRDLSESLYYMSVISKQYPVEDIDESN